MSAHGVYAGEARFPRGRRFAPQGKISETTIGIRAIGTKEIGELARREPLSRLAARFFVGLNVGTETKWTERDVIDAVVKIRREQGASPGARAFSRSAASTKTNHAASSTSRACRSSSSTSTV